MKKYNVLVFGIAVLAVLIASGCTPQPTGEYVDSWTLHHYLQTDETGTISGQVNAAWLGEECGSWLVNGALGATQYYDESIFYQVAATIPDGGAGCGAKNCYFLDGVLDDKGQMVSMAGRVCDCTNFPFVDCESVEPWGEIAMQYVGPLPPP